MKLSIWQQFSSNHSASYSVVGEFQSSRKAKAVFDEVLKIMRETQAWYFRNDDRPYWRKQPTPVEQEYAQLYGFDWKETVDWATYSFDKSIHHYDRLVIIDAGGGSNDTWQTGHQFVNLFTAMGAKVAREVMEGKEPGSELEVWLSLRFNVVCETDTEAKASELWEHFQKVFDSPNIVFDIKYSPWIVHHPKLAQSDYTHEMIVQMEQDYASDNKKYDTILRENPKMSGPEQHNLWTQVRKIPHEEWVWFGQLRREVRFFDSVKVRRENNRLIFSDIRPANIVIGLESFIAYLKQLGCTNIEYTVEQL